MTDRLPADEWQEVMRLLDQGPPEKRTLIEAWLRERPELIPGFIAAAKKRDGAPRA